MAYTAKPAKAKDALSLILAAVLLVCPASFTPAQASTYPNLDRALSLLLQAQSESDESGRLAMLNGALRDLNKAQNPRKGPAIDLVQSAISDLNAHDTGKANDDMTQAIAAIREAGGTEPASTSTNAAPATPTPANLSADNSFGTTTQTAAPPAPQANTVDPANNLRRALEDINVSQNLAKSNAPGHIGEQRRYLVGARNRISRGPTGPAYESHCTAAVKFIQAAIDALDKSDPDHTVGDLTSKAATEVQAAMDLASQSGPAPTNPSGSNPPAGAFGTFAPTPAAPVPPVPPMPIVKMTEDQARAVVLITGDNAEGTGFLIKTPDGPAVVTNLHVIANNPNFKITTNTGALVTVLSEKGASDRDLAMLAIQDAHYNYLEMAPDISQIVQPGDQVITPGNSQGGEVMLNTGGKVLGIGPVRIEFDNPVYHGNSGGPVFHVKSGKVLGVVTEAVKVDLSDALDKASFASRSSAISGSMRYFGLRLDTVSAWVPIDSRRFQNETAFLDQFDQRSRCLDCFINAPDDNKPEDTLWQKDDKIARANSAYFDQANGGDTAERLDALKVMWSGISDIAGLDMDGIQNPNNFYSFDQQRAKDEIAYRKAIKAELDQINNNVARLGSLPRTNNN